MSDINVGPVTLIKGTRSIFLGAEINDQTAIALIIALLQLDS